MLCLITSYLLCWCFLNVIVLVNSSTSSPNIVLIIADDLGWNDVGFHGSDQIPTPNIDALAYNGIILNKHYVMPTCTPSRVALMTGKYPIRTGLQADPGQPQEPWALSLDEKILPQYLKELGYKTHLIGKWHLGFYKKQFTPTERGFDSHFGYYNGWIRYNDSVTSSPPMIGIDARRNLQHAGNEFAEKYATDVFTNEAVKIIKNHDPRTPLFLDLSHVAVHAVKGNFLQVRNEKKNDEDFAYIVDEERRRLAGAIQAMDESVGAVIKALKEKQMLSNSIILFMSDNGGSTEDLESHYRNSASNWPLRGMKSSLFEGGVRGVAAIWSPLFTKQNHVSDELIHISDWLPTFLAAAGSNLQKLPNIDGINQWNLLTGNTTKTEREEILININHDRNVSAIIREKWKLISHHKTHRPSYLETYAGVSGRDENSTYDLNSVLSSTTNRLISNSTMTNSSALFLRLREEAKIDSQCQTRISNPTSSTTCRNDCLFDLKNDPCEFSNIAKIYPDVVNELKNRLSYFEGVRVPEIHAMADPRADPENWHHYWCSWQTWIEEEISSDASRKFTTGVITISIMVVICKHIANLLT